MSWLAFLIQEGGERLEMLAVIDDESTLRSSTFETNLRDAIKVYFRVALISATCRLAHRECRPASNTHTKNTAW